MRSVMLFSLGLILTSGLWAANPALTQDFKSLLTKYKVGLLANQSYCYKDAQGKIDGYQVTKLMPIASVTKLFTTYLASELLDLNKRYTTVFSIQDNNLHISGGLDPYFEEEKILLLMMALNDKGYKSFNKVTFDKKFKFSDAALGQYQVITPADTLAKLKIYFNSQVNKKYVFNKWKAVSVFADEEGVALDAKNPPTMAVKFFEIVDSNPLREPEVNFVHDSKPLHSLLKSMNVMSKNMVSQYIWEEATSIQSFSDFMRDRGFNPDLLTFYNGSGLPVKNGKIRKDNLAPCTVVLDLVEKLNISLRSHGFEPEDIVAINGGKDNGSFRQRFLKFPNTHHSVISKTGTLAISSALAGILKTDAGEIEFSILNKPSTAQGARDFQDHFVSKMFAQISQAKPIPYEKISIFPWDESDFFE